MNIDLGTALLIWMLVGTLAHEYGHSFMAKLCGYKTIGFSAFPIPDVWLEPPQKQLHSILILAGGWIFGIVSIPLFLPFVTPEYIVIFLITSLVIETVLSVMGDDRGIPASLWLGVKETWSEYHKFMFEAHNKMRSIGLSKMVIIDKKGYDKLIKESGLTCPEHSVAFFDKMDAKGWMVLLSLLALASALMVSLVNWPVFWILSQLEIEIEADFSVLFGY
jgi:hypothetical protein